MLDDAPKAAEGNDAVKQLLRYWLGEAEKGEIVYAIVIASWSPTKVATGKAGVIGMEFATYYGLDLAKDDIKSQAQNRMPPPPQEQATADHVLYNISKMPCSFDFLSWLIGAEMQRRREGAPAPLKLSWYFGRDGNKEAALSTEQRKQNFVNIMKPALQLIGAVEEEFVGGREHETVSFAPMIKAYKDGEMLPTFFPNGPGEDFIKKAMDQWGKPPVTITLREADHAPYRNSNVQEWIKFARWLESQGEVVVVIRDTAFAEKPLADPDGGGDFNIFPPASLDLMVRAALYSFAKCNLFVANGPVTLAFFMKTPWLMFNELREGGMYWANTAAGWKHFTGMDPGTQWPWSRPDQRIVWKPDTFEHMKDAWLEHIEPQRKEEEAA